MSVRPPFRPTTRGQSGGGFSLPGEAAARVDPACPRARKVRAKLLGLGLLGALWLAFAGCDQPLAVDPVETADGGGPCGRGKARSCQCADGRRGIAQCVAGSDWSECVCGESSFDVAEELPVDAGSGDAGRIRDLQPGDDTLGIPKSTLVCDQHIDMRAHAATSKADPYLIHGGPALGEDTDVAVCFFFRSENAVGDRATALQPLLDEVSRPHHWLLYGLDNAGTRKDGEVGPCKAIEPGAYLLGGFFPGSRDVVMPSDVGLALPGGEAGGYMLEVHYRDPGALELIDRTGVRVCTAPTNTPSRLKNTAAVHSLGTEGICIPPVRQGYEVSGTCRPHSDQGDIHILSVWPHMHRLGRRMTVTIVRKDGSREVLHDEPYNLNTTVLAETRDVVIRPGDKLETHCTYDSDQLFSVPFGEKVSDEMCFAFVTAWPAGALSTDPATLDPLRAWSLGANASRRCLDPYGILASCAGVADSPY